MAVNYVQTDVAGTFNVGCSGQTAGATNASRVATNGALAGTSEVTVDTGNQTTHAVLNFELAAPGVNCDWSAGDWTIRLNFTSGDAGTSLVALFVCDNNGGTYTTIAGLGGLSDATTAGVVTKTVPQGAVHSPQSAANSSVVIVAVLSNSDNHGQSAVGVTPDQILTAPYNIYAPIPGEVFAETWEAPGQIAAWDGDVLVNGGTLDHAFATVSAPNPPSWRDYCMEAETFTSGDEAYTDLTLVSAIPDAFVTVFISVDTDSLAADQNQVLFSAWDNAAAAANNALFDVRLQNDSGSGYRFLVVWDNGSMQFSPTSDALFERNQSFGFRFRWSPTNTTFTYYQDDVLVVNTSSLATSRGAVKYFRVGVEGTVGASRILYDNFDINDFEFSKPTQDIKEAPSSTLVWQEDFANVAGTDETWTDGINVTPPNTVDPDADPTVLAGVPASWGDLAAKFTVGTNPGALIRTDWGVAYSSVVFIHTSFYLEVDGLSPTNDDDIDVIVGKQNHTLGENVFALQCVYTNINGGLVLRLAMGTSFERGSTVAEISEDTFYDIEMKLDFTNKVVSVWIDGVMHHESQMRSSWHQSLQWLITGQSGSASGTNTTWWADRIYVSTVGFPEPATVISLVIADASHSHTVDNLALTQANTLVVDQSTHAQTVDNLDLAQGHTLTVAESSHAQTADSVVLTQANTLITDESTHAQSVENLDLTQANTLVVAESGHAQSVDNLDLAQGHTLLVEEAAHAQTSDNLELTTSTNLIVAESAHAQAVDELALTQANTLAVAEAAHAQAADALALIQANVLAVDESTHSQVADNLELSLANLLVIQEALHGQTVDALSLTQAHILSIDPASHGHTADPLTLTQANILLVQSALHAHSAGNVVLESGIILAIADAAHAQSADEIALTQAHILTVAGSLHAQSSDELALIQGFVLAVDDSTHTQVAENVTLDTALTLSVFSAAHAQSADNLSLTQANVLIVNDALHALFSDNLTLGGVPIQTATGPIVRVQADNRVLLIARLANVVRVID